MASLRDPLTERLDADSFTTPSDVWAIDQRKAPTDAAFAVHDAKNMLGVISANVEYLAEALGGVGNMPDIDSAMEDLRTATSRAAQLLRDALMALRGTQQSRRGAATSVRAGPVVMRAVERIQRRADAVGVTLDLCELRDQRTAIEADLLERVLDNLLDNALRFSKPGDVIEITCASRGGRLVMSVADQGPGVRDDELEAVFGAQDNAAVNDGHFGLGLAFCRSVARAHGGDMYVENRAAGGACFVLEIG